MRKTIATAVAVPIVLFVAALAYFIVSQTGTGRTQKAIVSVVFDLREYDFGVTFTDLAQLEMFDGVRCDGCAFNEEDPLTMAASDSGTGVDIGIWYQSPMLFVNFYGDDQLLVKERVAEFLSFLRGEPKFDRGFELQDRIANRRVEPIDEAEWLTCVSTNDSAALQCE